MSTETSTETETQTNSVTRTQGACALGAGAAAITCKAAFLGFLGAFAALAGLSAIGDLALTIGVFVIAIPLIWRGFRWAGRKPALLATGGLGLMWFGYTLAGVLVTGRGMFGAGMMPASSIMSNPLGLIPVGIAYVGGTALFGWGAWDSFGKELEVSKGGLGAGIAGASICGGCGITGLAGAAAVLLTGVSTNSMKFVGADLAMLLGVGGVLAVTLYKRAWIQSATVAAGGFVALVLFGMGMSAWADSSRSPRRRSAKSPARWSPSPACRWCSSASSGRTTPGCGSCPRTGVRSPACETGRNGGRPTNFFRRTIGWSLHQDGGSRSVTFPGRRSAVVSRVSPKRAVRRFRSIEA